ncbi:modular serine protease [Ceratitis capitata]|uniref:modular serine protease n=1 Tax=Ceratitis capitata TaxID=7213 RepID=UPI0003297D7E|nr:modular serine protease [Ceratitis capitata]
MFKQNKYLLWALMVITQMFTALSSNNTWSCSDTESIPRSKLCDGFVDCSNGRDETALECVTEPCSEDEYRCAYGACIKAEKKCNKQIDCYDRSDETDFLCGTEEEVSKKIRGNCSDVEFQCVSGECIDEITMCDGIVDCSDSSDETVESCSHIECSDLSFRCAYGACISIEQLLDTIWDCVDGSDEVQIVQSQPVSSEVEAEKHEPEKPDIETCSIPYQNPHLITKLIKDGVEVNTALSYYDKVLRHDFVKFECSPTFTLIGAERLECINNDWYRQWPHCERPDNLRPCRANETTCDNGDCINPAALCNGVKDCRDGSDEIPQKCLNRTCTENEYKCKYGACIPKDNRCDKKIHCADGSDETTLLCSSEDNYAKALQGSCESEDLIQCRSKECIEYHLICDGIPDCSDGSDESVEMCAHIQCTDSSFTCAYGGCVSNYVLCNGEVDCADGSDEIAEICAPIVIENQKYEDMYNYDDNVNTNIDQYDVINEKRNFVEKAIKEKVVTVIVGPEVQTKPVVVNKQETIHTEMAQKRCTIPPNRPALRVINEAQNVTIKVGGQVNAHDIVTFSCEDTWHLVDGQTEALCMSSGEWSTTVPRCEKRCLPQWSGISTHTTCSYKNKSADCQTMHSKPETKALVKCATGYKPLTKSEELICDDDGEWSQPKFKCKPQCVTLSGDMSKRAEVLVKIFSLGYKGSNHPESFSLKNDLQYGMACIGTIISPKLVLTSALCFSTNKLNNRIAANDPILYSILPAATKKESFGQYEQPPGRHNISQIFIADKVLGDNIDTPAIAVLADYFVIIPNKIMPICLQFSGKCLNHKIIETTEAFLEGTVALKGNDCFVLAGLTKYIFMDEYQQWLETKVMLHKYIL